MILIYIFKILIRQRRVVLLQGKLYIFPKKFIWQKMYTLLQQY